MKRAKKERKPAPQHQIMANAYLTVGGDWPKGRLFNRGEFHETLKMGYFPAGMMVESQGRRFIVVGSELEAL